eukprot:6133069-Pyramimonas_sp.AAC.1
MEVWYAELQEKRELLEAILPEDLFAIPTQMVPDQTGAPAEVGALSRLGYRGDALRPHVHHGRRRQLRTGHI